jgi:hypothetical protein
VKTRRVRVTAPVDETPITLADVRSEVAAFAVAMERKLRENDYKGGWKDEPRHYLLASLCNELAELVSSFKPIEKARESTYASVRLLRYAASELETFGPCGGPVLRITDDVIGEAVDVANFAMMLADMCGSLR